MLVAVLATSSVAEAATEYPEVQQAIKRARAELQRQVDAYLLLLVPTVSADVYPEVRAALDDPLICRKVVIELGSDEPSGALRRQFPLLANSLSDEMQPGKEAASAPDPGPEDLELLDRNGADNIVDLLLARARPAERDA
jgi:hypothetical protein